MRKNMGRLLICMMAAAIMCLPAISSVEAGAKKALVVVSFGTTFPEARTNDIEGIENALRKAFPDRDFRRAFTSKIVMKRMLENQKIKVADLDTTLAELKQAGYQDVLIQPTHLIHGEEYEQKILATVGKYRDNFKKIAIGQPLMAKEADYKLVAKALSTQFPKLASKEAVVFMGHGSPRDNNKSFGSTYKKLQQAFDSMGVPVVIGVVEDVDYPNFKDMYGAFKARGYTSAVLMPLMVVAGDHAYNDLAGAEPDSWKSVFEKDSYKTKAQMGGIGRNKAIQAIYVRHANEAKVIK